jgi:F-type H+-transporting ATPase subunit b
LAIAVSQKLIGESLDERRQHTLVDEFFSGIKSGRVILLDNTGLEGSAAEIVSALPLTSEEKETVKSEICDRIGPQATITFRVDPSILGGLIVRVGDQVLDASVASQLESLRQRLV